METASYFSAIAQTEPTLPMVPQSRVGDLKPHWYAAYTCANHEKRVAEQLGLRSIEYFLPLFQTVRQWKDRRKRLELPLFPGYVFMRLPVQERSRVLELASVVRLVGFGALPCVIPDREIEALRNVVSCRLRAEPHLYPAVGRRVRIIRGPLEGIEGTLVRKKGIVRLVLSVDIIRKSATVEVDLGDVEPIKSSEPL
jgi:transcription antitermination factor NusG